MRKQLLQFGAVFAASLISVVNVGANLVVNGGFETGDFTGWIQFGNTDYTGVDNGTGFYDGTGFVAPHSGSYQAYFGAIGSVGGIYQTLATIVGQSYIIDFWVYNFGGTPSEMQIKWGTDTLVDTMNPDAFTYTEYSLTVVAGGPTVQFGFRQDPDFFLLDDISVTPVPEPTTMIAGALMLLPFGLSTIRMLRKHRMA